MKYKNKIILSSLIFLVCLFIFGVVRANAYDTYGNSNCDSKCTGDKECKLDMEAGTYSCVSTGGTGGSGNYDSATCNGKCSSSQECALDTDAGTYSCVKSGSTNYGSTTNSDGSKINSSGSSSIINSTNNPASSGSTNTNPNLTCDSTGICFPSNTSLPSANVITILSNILNWILGIFGILAVIAFVISGTQYILSVGDEKAVDNAKRSMTWSIVGVVVALSGLLIIFAIDKMLRGVSNF